MFYGDCVKICEDFTLNFGNKNTGSCNTTKHSRFLFHHGFFLYRKQNGCRPHPTYFSLFPRLNLNLKGSHFDIIKVIEAESQAVLNTPTDQDAFKK
jgi:hypothetical protein